MRTNQALFAVIMISVGCIAYMFFFSQKKVSSTHKATSTVGVTPVPVGTTAPTKPIPSLNLPNAPPPVTKPKEKSALITNNTMAFPTTDFMVSSRSVPTIRQFAEEFIQMIVRFRIHDPDNNFLEPEWMSLQDPEERVRSAIDELQGITNNSKMNLIYDCIKNAMTLEEYKKCYQYIYA